MKSKTILLFLILSATAFAQPAWTTKNKLFIAGGNPYTPNLNGEINISEDGGHTWQKVWSKSQQGYQVKDMAFGNKKIVAVTELAILTSTDGKTWKEVSNLPEKIPGAMEGIAFGDGLFVIVGSSETILYSTDGEQWKILETVYYNTEDPKQKEARKKLMEKVNVSKIPAAARPQAPKETVDDLIFGLDTRNHFLAVTYENNRFMLTGSFQRALYLNKKGNELEITQEDYRHNEITRKCYGALYASNTWLLLGDANYTSKDGKTFQQTYTASFFKDAAFGKNLFVAAGSFGTIAYSADGTDFTKAEVPGSKNLTTYFDVAFGNGRFLAAGQHGAMAISDDGKTWKNVGTEGQANQPSYQCLVYAEF